MKRGTVRFSRETKTIDAMIGIYCRGNHGAAVRCAECRTLLDYVLQRLEKCPHGEGKPVCAKCPVHCYNPEMRGQILAVMRYAGPRLRRQAPVLSLLHRMRGWFVRANKPARASLSTGTSPVPASTAPTQD